MTDMDVAAVMSRLLVAVGPGHTLQETAAMMAERRVGSAVVVDPAHAEVSIFTERDLLRAAASGADMGTTPVGNHLTTPATVVTAETDLSEAAVRMLEGEFRHLVVVDEYGQPCGVLSMRDIVRCWVERSAAQA